MAGAVLTTEGQPETDVEKELVRAVRSEDKMAIYLYKFERGKVASALAQAALGVKEGGRAADFFQGMADRVNRIHGLDQGDLYIPGQGALLLAEPVQHEHLGPMPVEQLDVVLRLMMKADPNRRVVVGRAGHSFVGSVRDARDWLQRGPQTLGLGRRKGKAESGLRR